MLSEQFTIASFLVILSLTFANLDNEQSNSIRDYKILPLIYVDYENHYYHPTNLKRKTVAKDGLSFSSGTIFAFESQGKQLYFCPPVTDAYDGEIHKALELYNEYPHFEEYSKDLVYSRYCQFECTFEIKESLTCPMEANPALRKITRKFREEEKDESCGPGDGKLYEFFYMACPIFGFMKKTWKFWEAGNTELRNFIMKLPYIAVKRQAYQFCYDHVKKETLYAMYRLNPSELFFDKEMEYERIKNFPFKTEGYMYFGTDFETIRNVYEKDSSPEKPNNSNTNDVFFYYKPHQLVPAAHLPLAIWKKTTFHYANIRPMHENLIDLWNHIDNLILQHVQTKNVSLDIYTGAFDVIYNKKPIKDSIQIPEIWVKLIHDTNDKKSFLHEGLAIILKNDTDITSEEYCPENLCYAYLNREEVKEINPNAVNQICCQLITDEFLELFKIKLYSPLVLPIETLIS